LCRSRKTNGKARREKKQQKRGSDLYGRKKSFDAISGKTKESSTDTRREKRLRNKNHHWQREVEPYRKARYSLHLRMTILTRFATMNPKRNRKHALSSSSRVKANLNFTKLEKGGELTGTC